MSATTGTDAAAAAATVEAAAETTGEAASAIRKYTEELCRGARCNMKHRVSKKN